MRAATRELAPQRVLAHTVSRTGDIGAPERLGDDGQPSAPGPGEIIVRVRACGLNHVDAALSTGATAQLFAHGAPSICGLDAAGTVIGAGERVTRFAVGDEVFGHFPAESWACVDAPCVRTTADGPHVELRPEALDPLAAAALARSGLTAKTILRSAELKPGQTTLVIGATSPAGTPLLSLLAETGARVIAIATDTIDYTTADLMIEALTSDLDLDLLVDLVGFDEPYFITAAARQGTIVSTLPRPNGPSLPRIGISAEPGELAALAQRALDERQPANIARVDWLERPATHRRPSATPPPQPALVLDSESARPDVSIWGRAA